MKRKYVGIYRKACVEKAERVSISCVHVSWWKSRTLCPWSRANPWSIYPFYGFFGVKNSLYTIQLNGLRRLKAYKDAGFEVPSAELLNFRLGYVFRCEICCTQLLNVGRRHGAPKRLRLRLLKIKNCNILQTWIYKTNIFQFWI